jgi:hypothetical protein
VSEQEIQQQIRLQLGRGPVRLWRNNTGALLNRRGQMVTYGLCVGSSDLIGLRQVVIGPEHLGQTLAVFSAIEVKGARDPTAEQLAFIAAVQNLGGLAGVARSVEDANSILKL